LPACATLSPNLPEALLQALDLGQPDKFEKLTEAWQVGQRSGWCAVATNRLQHLLNAASRREQCADGEDNDAEAQLRKARVADGRRLATLGPVEQERHALQLSRDRLDLGLTLGASKKMTSAPASRYSFARCSAPSMPSTARASVRAISTRSVRRAATAARSLASMSSTGTSCLPSMWPHFFGAT